MMLEILSNKWFWFLIGIIFFFVGYKLMFNENKLINRLDQEYYEVLHSEKYKVKSQFD